MLHRAVLFSAVPFLLGVLLAWGCADGTGDDGGADECEHIEEHAEEACAGSGETCHDSCHDEDPSDAADIGDCLHEASDCDAAAACVAGTAIDGCVPI